jgi:rubrerythrin
MDTRDAVLEILSKAYQIEVDGYTFYSMAADHVTRQGVRDLFGQLAADERQHQAYLREIGEHFSTKGVAAFQMEPRLPSMNRFLDQVFTQELKQQVAGATMEAGALSVGITLEVNAIAYFTSAAESAPADPVRDFYLFLADWERQHLQALQNAFNALRADFPLPSGAPRRK